MLLSQAAVPAKLRLAGSCLLSSSRAVLSNRWPCCRLDSSGRSRAGPGLQFSGGGFSALAVIAPVADCRWPSGRGEPTVPLVGSGSSVSASIGCR
jgi:hypothetical protein